MAFLLILFAKWKSALMGILLLAGSLLGLKVYANAKQNEKNKKKLAIYEGKEKVAGEVVEIGEKTKVKLKEIDDEDSEGILARLNKRRPPK
jgi:hypothetical protein